MCFPLLAAVPYIVLAASAAGAVVAHNETNKAAERQEKAIQDGLALDRAATARQYEQINESAANEGAQRHTEYLIDDARLRAVMGETGLQGATTDRLLLENSNNAATDIATLENNRGNQAEMAHTQSLASANKGAVQLSGVRHASNIGTGLQIVGAAGEFYEKAKPYKRDPILVAEMEKRAASKP